MTTFDSTYDSPFGPEGPGLGGECGPLARAGGPRAWKALFASHHRGGPHHPGGGFGFGGPGRGFGGRGDFGFGGPGRGFGGRGDFGFGGPGGGPFGPGPRGPFGRGGGRRARRGDVRLAALLLLAEEPRNGYAIMQELEQRSDGMWRPSPGSVYPALAQLEDEGLIRSREGETGRVFELTEAGQAQVAERPEDAPAPWDTVGQGVPDTTRALFDQMRQLGAAVIQVAHSGSTGQAEQAAGVLDQARRSIYRILADGESDEQSEA